MKLLPLLLACGLLVSTGCFHGGGVKPGRTQLSSRLTVIPAELAGNHLLIEVKWDKHGPWRFVVDTGSSVTLVSPEFARRYATDVAALDLPPVRVRGATGETLLLTGVRVKRIELGDVRFENVQTLLYDLGAISAHFGKKIDGVLGFPLFRETLLTLDYPQSRLLITPTGDAPLLPGATVGFNNQQRTPLIPISIGGEAFIALIDSGSDGALHLNPVGLRPTFAYGPRPGAVIGTIGSSRLQEIGRLEQPLKIGDYTFVRPIVDLTNELSSIGGEVLKHFTVTFDQARNQVTFFRPNAAPIESEPKRSAGVSFTKTPVYWRVLSVVPDSPADKLGVQAGDLITRINGELVTTWDLRRYEELVRTTDAINYTFLNGRVEKTERLPTFDLVP